MRNMDCSGEVCILEKTGESPEYQVGKGRFFLDNGCYFPLKKSVKSISKSKSTKRKGKGQSGQGKLVRKANGIKSQVKKSIQTGNGLKKRSASKKKTQTGRGRVKSRSKISLKPQRGKGHKKQKRLKPSISHKKTIKRVRSTRK